jgi:hypothetical protein
MENASGVHAALLSAAVYELVIQSSGPAGIRCARSYPKNSGGAGMIVFLISVFVLAGIIRFSVLIRNRLDGRGCILALFLAFSRWFLQDCDSRDPSLIQGNQHFEGCFNLSYGYTRLWAKRKV